MTCQLWNQKEYVRYAEHGHIYNICYYICINIMCIYLYNIYNVNINEIRVIFIGVLNHIFYKEVKSNGMEQARGF